MDNRRVILSKCLENRNKPNKVRSATSTERKDEKRKILQIT